jgi:hypothetical protein
LQVVFIGTMHSRAKTRFSSGALGFCVSAFHCRPPPHLSRSIKTLGRNVMIFRDILTQPTRTEPSRRVST